MGGTPVPDSYTSGLTITYLEMYKAGRKTSSFTSSAFCPKSQKLDSFVIYTSLKVKSLSRVWLFVTWWMGFSR